MKILMTGKNRSGKTTLLRQLLAPLRQKQGFITAEVRQDGDRTGFDLLDQSGNTAPLARTGQPTAYPVGRYFVDVAALDRFLPDLRDIRKDQLLYVDEIGQMQLYSPQFKALVLDYMKTSNHFIGTITSIYEDAFVEQMKRQSDILCEITPENRAEIAAGLSEALAHRDAIDSFNAGVRQALYDMANDYLENDEYVYFKKLFKNAVPYLAEGRLQPQPDSSYFLMGQTNHHHIVPAEADTFACDCDLFHGRGQFAGYQGLCSHIQTVQLFTLAGQHNE